MDYTVHGILQARILEWVAVYFSRDLPNPGIEPRSPELQADSLLAESRGKSSGGLYYFPWQLRYQMHWAKVFGGLPLDWYQCLALCLTVGLDELTWELRIYFCQVSKAKPEVFLL